MPNNYDMNVEMATDAVQELGRSPQLAATSTVDPIAGRRMPDVTATGWISRTAETPGSVADVHRRYEYAVRQAGSSLAFK